MNQPYTKLISALALGSLLLLPSGCTKTSCSRDPDQVDVPLSQGIRDGNTYYSAPAGGPYEYFPAARTIRFEPPLTITEEQIEYVCKALGESLEAMSRKTVSA